MSLCFAGSSCGGVGLGAAIGGALPDSSFTASTYSIGLRPSYGRLDGPSGWCSAGRPDDEYLQVDLGSVFEVCSVATQGYNFAYWVTNYQISYSEDGVNYVTVTEGGDDKVCLDWSFWQSQANVRPSGTQSNL